jgi:hypothetical protein
MPDIQLDTKFARREDLGAVPLGDEMGLLHQELGKYFALDSIGTDIWSLCAKPVTVSQVVDELLNSYEVERSVCENDVLDFIRQLDNARMICISYD